MEDEEIINPWITVSKRKRNRTFGQFDSARTIPSKSEVENLHSNSFINLSLQESHSDSLSSNGKSMSDPTDLPLPPSSPAPRSPPRKKSKKDPKKVCPSTAPFLTLILQVALSNCQSS